MAKKEYSIGSLSFLIGAGVAVIAGIVSPSGTGTVLTSALIVLGIIVGILNVTTKEINSFLMATVSLVIVSALGGAVLGQVAVIGTYLEAILVALLTFIIPSILIVALKSVYSLAATN